MAVQALIFFFSLFFPFFFLFFCTKQLNYHGEILSSGQIIIKFNFVLQSLTVYLTSALLIQHTQM